MRELDFNVEFKDGTGNVVSKETVNELLANIIHSGSDKKNPLKLFEWANALQRGEILKVDSSDFGFLKGFVQENAQMTNMAKGTVLTIMEKAKEV